MQAALLSWGGVSGSSKIWCISRWVFLAIFLTYMVAQWVAGLAGTGHSVWSSLQMKNYYALLLTVSVVSLKCAKIIQKLDCDNPKIYSLVFDSLRGLLLFWMIRVCFRQAIHKESPVWRLTGGWGAVTGREPHAWHVRGPGLISVPGERVDLSLIPSKEENYQFFFTF